jgi:putative ABC transport system ATP-binding protein
MLETVLQTKSVTKTYDVGSNTIRAVDDVSLDIQAGEFIGLVGPSGSGKTTMLAILAGLLSPSEGTIQVNGRSLDKMSEAERTRFRRQKIGFTFQDNNLVPYLNVQENVELMLKLTGQFSRRDRERARDLLERLGLAERLKNLPSQLSGGQQQRVAIARALVHQPDIVLADEPTASLDTERAHQVVKTFAQMIHEERLAGIMVTHDLRMCRYVDRIVQMRDGQISQIIADRTQIERFASDHA